MRPKRAARRPHRPHAATSLSDCLDDRRSHISFQTMALIAVGLNHLTAPLAFRERVAFAPEDTASALAALTAQPGVQEAAILSTCNRTELYCNVDGGNEAAPAEWLQHHHQLTGARLGEFLYLHADA